MIRKLLGLLDLQQLDWTHPFGPLSDYSSQDISLIWSALISMN